MKRLIRDDLLWIEPNAPPLDPAIFDAAVLRCFDFHHLLWPSRSAEVAEMSGEWIRHELDDAKRLIVELDPKIRRGHLSPAATDWVIASYAEAAGALLEIGRFSAARQLSGYFWTLIPYASNGPLAGGALRLQALGQLKAPDHLLAEGVLYMASRVDDPTPAHTLLDAVLHGQMGMPEISEELLNDGLRDVQAEGWKGLEQGERRVRRLSMPALTRPFDPYADPA